MIEEQQAEQQAVTLTGTQERRGKRRFNIQREARYKLLYGNRIAETGIARTVNISSSGIWFTTDSALPTGVPVEVQVSWPALLNDYCPMKLMIFGCVVRSTPTGAAVNIERYEFRTQGSGAFRVPPLAEGPETPSAS